MRRYAIAVALGVFAAGCTGDKLVPVAGTVTVDNVPVADGEIQFIPDNPAHATQAARIAAGKYELTARPGKNMVKITATRSTGFKGGFEYFENFAPPRYNEKTELTADVPAGGKPDLDFPLKSDKK